MSQHHLSQQPVFGQPDDVSHPAQSAGPQEANEVEGWIAVFLGVAAVKAVGVIGVFLVVGCVVLDEGYQAS
jgi:hypothetical protein